ncbi:MAG: hypothetical protein H5U40_14955, partial [Polyangiaceae bacterium]|nr:hypothetical protein [Polyangiaceae bacterium]
FSLSLPIVALFLLPDLVAYTLSGFDALGMLVRFTAPLSFAATLALATLAMRVSHGLASGRAFVSAAAGVVSQAVIGGVFLR